MTDPQPVSAFYPADNAATIAHLNHLQAIITRLAGNSAQCKTWCLAIVSALFGFAGAARSDNTIAAAAIIPIVIFCLVDAAYLGREKAYRDLYNAVVSDIHNGAYRLSGCFNVTPPEGGGHFGKALCSWSVLPVYLSLVALYVIYWAARAYGLLK